ncbi:MAG TPA: hypothetical protein VL977_06710 [Solirubrobacteraceae bacterium]|nr:hypothetical protein [Solirubrobacteraceae bacterium]
MTANIVLAAVCIVAFAFFAVAGLIDSRLGRRARSDAAARPEAAQATDASAAAASAPAAGREL